MSNGIKRAARLSRKGIGLTGGALVVAGAALLSGCYGTVGAEVPAAEVDVGVPVVQAEVVPMNIYAYPHVYYRGSYAYYVDGRWYYPGRRGWYVMREEPRELSRYRSTYIQRYRTAPGYAYPPERRYRRYYP